MLLTFHFSVNFFIIFFEIVPDGRYQKLDKKGFGFLRKIPIMPKMG